MSSGGQDGWAPVPRVAAAIRSARLANIKAPRIEDVLRGIWDEQG